MPSRKSSKIPLTPPLKKGEFQIQQAKELGFCFGVRRALKIILKAASEHQPVVTLGPIVHNQGVVNKLSSLGIEVVANPEEVKGDTIAVSSHGIAPDLLEEIVARDLKVIDTTCPNVRSAQKAAKKLAESGFRVIIFGEASHPEVKGLLGWAGENAVAALKAGDIKDLKSWPRLGILSQTTQAQSQFSDFVYQIMGRTFETAREIRLLNTLCRETVKRQEAALQLAGRSDLMIVVGGLNSANTRGLADICTPLVETHLLEEAAAIDPSWLQNKQTIGVTAGASTPDEAIEEVVSRLKELKLKGRKKLRG